MAALVLLAAAAEGLVVNSVGRTPVIAMVAEAPVSDAPAAGIQPERYVATNRFRVKDGREAAFEKRWADRKSRLGLLEGFRFFCMMRRTDRFDGAAYDDDVNYISCTVWEEVDAFDAWKKGDAFKEAHGGGTIGGIASMLMATARNTKGKPKAAMWEGLLPVSMPGAPSSESGDGWREVIADGQTQLDRECFIAMNRFSVLPGMEAAFEARFASRESTLSTFGGFKGFALLRRDGKDDDGFTHSTWSVWKDRAAFAEWKDSEDRAGKPKAKPQPAAAKGAASGAAKPAGGPPSLFARPPVPTFYEGILMLESAKGV